MQHNIQHIILTAQPRIWTLGIVYNDVFNIASTETAYEEHRFGNSDTNRNVLMDDDRPLFNYYLSIAVSDLTGLLARRIDPRQKGISPCGAQECNNGIDESCWDIVFYLVMDENHDEHLRASLHRHCMDFLVKRVLEQWYRKQGMSDQAKAAIIRVLEFRRKPVRRPIRNML